MKRAEAETATGIERYGTLRFRVLASGNVVMLDERGVAYEIVTQAQLRDYMDDEDFDMAAMAEAAEMGPTCWICDGYHQGRQCGVEVQAEARFMAFHGEDGY